MTHLKVAMTHFMTGFDAFMTHFYDTLTADMTHFHDTLGSKQCIVLKKKTLYCQGKPCIFLKKYVSSWEIPQHNSLS